MKVLLTSVFALSLVSAMMAESANAYQRYRRAHRPYYYRTYNNAIVSTHEGIARYGRIGSTMPHSGTPTGYENEAPIGYTQTH